MIETMMKFMIRARARDLEKKKGKKAIIYGWRWSLEQKWEL